MFANNKYRNTIVIKYENKKNRNINDTKRLENRSTLEDTNKYVRKSM